MIRAPVCMLLMLASVWIVVDETPKKKLIFFFVYYGLSIVADVATWMFGTALGMTVDELMVRTEEPVRILGTALYPIFLMTFGSIFMSYYTHIDKPIRRRICVGMLLTLVSHCMFAIALSQQEELLAENVLIYACVCIFLGVVVQYIMYETINRSVAAVRDRMELEHLKEKQAMDLKYIQMAQESAGETSAFRHDFKNQLQVAYALLEEEPERAAAFLKELETKVDQIGSMEPKA